MRTLTKKFTTISAAIGAALLVALTSCSAPSAPDARPTSAAETEAPADCSGLTGVEALAKWAGDLETTQSWDLVGESSDVSGYDECAELSHIVLRPVMCCTAFEITPVMFFNRGEFIPAASVTDRAQPKSPDAVAERINDSTIALSFAVSGGANTPPIITKITYAWDEDSGTVVAEASQPVADEFVGGDANGRWCPSPESQGNYGCVTIALPTATYDSGEVSELTDRGDLNGDGSTVYIATGAPFGAFYPAGTPITLPDYYKGADLPDEARIWNAQTAVMLVRQ